MVHFGQGGRLLEDFGRDPGPALLPELLLAGLALAGVALALRGWAGLRRTSAATKALSQSPTWPALAAIALMAIFLPLRDLIGAEFTLTGIGASLAVLAGRNETRSQLFSAILGGAVGFALFVLFNYGLSVPL